MMVRPGARGVRVARDLFTGIYESLAACGVTLFLADCQPHLLAFYETLGMRTYGRAFNHCGSGIGIPLMASCADREYQQSIRGALSNVFSPEREDREVAARLDDVLAQCGNPVASKRSSPDAFRAAVDGIETRLDDREYGHVLQCNRGDQLVSCDQRLHTAYLVLDGELELRDRDGIRRLGTGQTLGAAGPAVDGFVASATARVLCVPARLMRRQRHETAAA